MASNPYSPPPGSTLGTKSNLMRLALGGRTDLARVCEQQGLSAETAERIGLMFLLVAEELRGTCLPAGRA